MNFPLRPFSSYLTKPEISAYSVSSDPRPTLFPGLNLVPRCRTRIVPPCTASPPNRFTPSRCAFESRPFLELPTPFLCAIRSSISLSCCHPLLGPRQQRQKLFSST